MSDDTRSALFDLLENSRRGVVAAIKSDGLPQLSNVDYAYDSDRRTIRFSTTDGRAKIHNLRRDPRACFYVTTPDGSSYAVFECRAEFSDVARQPDDAANEELVDVYRAVQGEHPDWDDYRAAMIADRRLVVRLHVQRAYGWIRE
jgi:PPOX class probable F420-dependent enzyme